MLVGHRGLGDQVLHPGYERCQDPEGENPAVFMSFFLFRGNTNSSLRFRSTVLGCLAIVGLTSFCSRPLTFVFHCGGCSIQHCKCYKESPSFIWMQCLRHAVFEFHGTRLCDQVSDLTLRSRLSSLVAIRLLSMVTQHSMKTTEY